MSVNNQLQARIRGAIEQLLNAGPPKSKDEAEMLASLTAALSGLSDASNADAECVVHQAEAAKTAAEVEDITSPAAKKQRRLEHWVNRLGMGFTFASFAGAVYFYFDMRDKKAEIEDEKAKVVEKQKKIDDLKDVEARAKETWENAKRSVELAQGETTHAGRQRDDADKAKGEAESAKATAVKEKDEAIKSKQEALAAVQRADEELRQKREQQAAIVAAEEGLRNSLEALKPETKAKLASLLGVEHGIVVASGYKTGRDPASVADDVELERLKPEVEKLFSDSPTERGRTYSTLTTGKDRTTKALALALLQLGEKKLKDYQDIKATVADPRSDTRLIALRRGLENVVVTMRDMSRSVTKKDEEMRQKLLTYARSLKVIEFGAGAEAASLERWLDNGNYN